LCQESDVRAITEADLEDVVVWLHIQQVCCPASMRDRHRRHPREQRSAEEPPGVLQLFTNRIEQTHIFLDLLARAAHRNFMARISAEQQACAGPTRFVPTAKISITRLDVAKWRSIGRSGTTFPAS
jgi:hypothetical protein